MRSKVNDPALCGMNLQAGCSRLTLTERLDSTADLFVGCKSAPSNTVRYGIPVLGNFRLRRSCRNDAVVIDRVISFVRGGSFTTALLSISYRVQS